MSRTKQEALDDLDQHPELNGIIGAWMDVLDLSGRGEDYTAAQTELLTRLASVALRMPEGTSPEERVAFAEELLLTTRPIAEDCLDESKEIDVWSRS